MAFLEGDTGALRLRLEFVDRERGTVPVAGEGGPAPAGRLLARAAVEYLDRRDGEHWPILALPALRVAPEAARALYDGLAALLQGAAPGFAWQSGEDAAVGLQLGIPDGAAEGSLVVEVGLDMGIFLAEAAQAPRRPGMELALFRFPASRAAAVGFADALRAEVEQMADPC